MYISEFVCGIIATLGVELVALIIYTFKTQKDEKKEEQENAKKNRK